LHTAARSPCSSSCSDPTRRRSFPPPTCGVIPRSLWAGDPFVAAERAETPCFDCLDTGWVLLTSENDYGELEDYFVLCRKCKERSEGFGGGTRITRGGARRREMRIIASDRRAPTI
jgi:hypothetical protein